MAYYDNAPKKKSRINYGDTGSWDEEGTHYRNRGNETRGDGKRSERGSYGSSGRDGRKNSFSSREPYGRNDRRESYGRKERNGVSRPEGRSEDRREYGRGDRATGRQERRDTRGERGGYRPMDRESRAVTPERSKEGYRDYEYRPRPQPESFTAEEQDDRILCGRNPIREALRSGREIEKILVQKGELSGSAREIVSEAREKKIMVQEVDKRRLDEIALHHQGLIAFASAYAYAEVEDILAEAERRQEAPFIVILDGVTDPHNLGAVIRTAECVGAHGVIIPLHRSVGLTPAAVKASAGAIEHMKVARVMNLNRTIDDLKRQGVWTYAVTMDGKDYEKVDFRGGTALVIGAEGEGISRLTAEKCDLSVSLPMKGELDSLNASVAAGVMMYRVLSSRRKG